MDCFKNFFTIYKTGQKNDYYKKIQRKKYYIEQNNIIKIIKID